MAVTKAFEELRSGPQTSVSLSDLNYEERGEVRRIDVRGTAGLTPSTSSGEFTRVTYLIGDEVAAARLFVEENRKKLEAIDYSKKNILQTSVDRTILDLILHELGERVVTVFDSVVIEERSDGTVWILSRAAYDGPPDQRYSTRPGRAKVPQISDLVEIFESQGTGIMTKSLLEDAGVQGDVTQVLRFYTEAYPSDCELVKSGNGVTALEKY